MESERDEMKPENNICPTLWRPWRNVAWKGDGCLHAILIEKRKLQLARDEMKPDLMTQSVQTKTCRRHV